MQNENHDTVQIACAGLYAGPASIKDDRITFLFAAGPRQRRSTSCTINGATRRVSIEPIRNYDPLTNPFLQATILPETAL